MSFMRRFDPEVLVGGDEDASGRAAPYDTHPVGEHDRGHRADLRQGQRVADAEVRAGAEPEAAQLGRVGREGSNGPYARAQLWVTISTRSPGRTATAPTCAAERPPNAASPASAW